ncbi:bifunctional 4-hydroxy-2-oxoglutarate aldolase/2-dehydro-3-deoxy-phosphogluconate aldolase [Chitinophaga rhizosphaerae]|uniref:bifunctional 4-hydroxy-2-oxoglutarate aldolase/2-dehydro-3-deoxy-phosphogluconate aldolase n=1 Tax=Chitinophaga rhizosphaerae TaxID=1864947 RepID=UPI000F80C134|nr:bifunctional 4-hydroxy-2-oxoglutarate aldolase/2-dehydro-3-deoxy-phosphogluconate aldolase [Chitinophaga rhizosphaerae]
MPAVTLHREDDVLPVAEALLEGGLDVMEITFRTGIAAKAIALIRKKFPEMHVGAGTLIHPEQIKIAVNAGARFGVAPGLNKVTLEAAARENFPFIPGIATASELENALMLDCKLVKVFPCDLLGGVAVIRALQQPYGHTGMKFIPMGGVNLANLHEYVAPGSVMAVGGSWIASGELIERRNFAAIAENARKSITITDQRIH